MWETKKVPLDEKAFIWIKDKVNSTRTGQVIIEIKDNKAAYIHYICSEFFVDVDKEPKK